MSPASEQDRYQNAKESAQASYDTIAEMVADLAAAYDAHEDNEIEAAQEVIQQDPLSVEVNYGWQVPGVPQEREPEEYAILLATGGPAIRVRGTMNGCEPVTAWIEVQDWFLPWQRFDPPNFDQVILLQYAREFYFGDC